MATATAAAPADWAWREREAMRRTNSAPQDRQRNDIG
jgi:hypothetical protein